MGNHFWHPRADPGQGNPHTVHIYSYTLVRENGFSVKMTLKIEKFEKRAADLKSARKNASESGPTFYFRAWEGKNTHNPRDLG